MKIRKWIHFLLILPLLINALSLTQSAYAAGPALADPPDKVIWCPATVSPPTSNKNGCTLAYSTFGALMTRLSEKDPAIAGKVWIGKDYNSSTAMDADVYFDGLTALPKMAKYALTIQGGWNGLGTQTVDPSQPSNLDGDSLGIDNWHGNVTVRNIRVLNASTGCAGGVCVFTAGNIKLDRVFASVNTTAAGIYLDNQDSLRSPPGSVTVTNSESSDNTYNNLVILSKGAITLKNVTASRSVSIGYAGATISNHLDNYASPVSITNGHFNTNNDDGLMILSNGTVTLVNVEAKDNVMEGAVVANTHAPGNGSVVFKGTNTFLSNGSIGLEVYTNGNVTANHLIAYYNGVTSVAQGVSISAKKAVTITGSGKFKGNSAGGLSIYSGGPIIASNLTANTNDATGLFLLSTALPAAQALTLNQVNADLNGQAGIEIYADGKITLACSSAYDNNSTGLYVRAYTAGSIPAALKLQGFLAYSNAPDEDIPPTTTPVRTNCP
jgi:hypothetical protein